MLSMPAIWARFSLEKVDRFTSRPGRLAARLQACLKHSRDLPLKHWVYYEANSMVDGHDTDEEDIAPLDLLLAHTHTAGLRSAFGAIRAVRLISSPAHFKDDPSPD